MPTTELFCMSVHVAIEEHDIPRSWLSQLVESLVTLSYSRDSRASWVVVVTRDGKEIGRRRVNGRRSADRLRSRIEALAKDDTNDRIRSRFRLVPPAFE